MIFIRKANDCRYYDTDTNLSVIRQMYCAQGTIILVIKRINKILQKLFRRIKHYLL